MGDALTFVSIFLLQIAISFDIILVISLLFDAYRIPVEVRPRVLYATLAVAIVMQPLLFVAGAYVLQRWPWLFVPFGYLHVHSGLTLLFPYDDDVVDNARPWFLLRRFGPSVRCGVSIISVDLAIALDVIPIALSVSTNLVILVAASVLATIALRCAVRFVRSIPWSSRNLRIAVAVLLIVMGVRMIVR